MNIAGLLLLGCSVTRAIKAALVANQTKRAGVLNSTASFFLVMRLGINNCFLIIYYSFLSF